MKNTFERIQSVKGTLRGNGTIFGREAGHPIKRLPSRNSHNKDIRKNPSPLTKLRLEQTALAKNIAKEICGYSPYEKKAIDLARKGEEKKMKKFLKKRLGSLKAAKKKQETLILGMRGHQL
ncbi:large subunit ribosomal protein L36e [Nematocida sp. AWRm77]|nr:large subunit ribosomal protein L36e [Nematocida sp. AWRm77]